MGHSLYSADELESLMAIPGTPAHSRPMFEDWAEKHGRPYGGVVKKWADETKARDEQKLESYLAGTSAAPSLKERPEAPTRTPETEQSLLPVQENPLFPHESMGCHDAAEMVKILERLDSVEAAISALVIVAEGLAARVSKAPKTDDPLAALATFRK